MSARKWKRFWGSRLNILTGKCLSASRVSYMEGHLFLTLRVRVYLMRTNPTLNKTFTPSHMNMSQMRRTQDHGRVLKVGKAH